MKIILAFLAPALSLGFTSYISRPPVRYSAGVVRQGIKKSSNFPRRLNQQRPILFSGISDEESEVEAILAQAKKLRAEAASIEAAFAAEKATKLATAFSQFDSNSDGLITYSELITGLKKNLKTEDLDETAVRRLFGELDSDGNNVLDVEEFKMGVSEMATRIDSYIREEKQAKIEAEKEAKLAKEKADKALQKLEFLNDKPPNQTEKVLSVLPYLFPLMDGLQYGRFLLQGEDNIIINAIALVYIVYRQIPFSGFVAFFALNFLAGNPKLNRLVRWNLQQAIFVDIALIFPGLLQGLAKFALPAVGLSLPASFTETFDDVTFVALLGVLGYCAVSSLLGREPGGIPFVSKAVGDRMPTIDMFDDEGRFIPRQMREKDDEEGGGGSGGDAGGKDEKK
ncbi:hypothetical protein TrST_g7816 [Triparma strigata]|uniref:EF-hand domain-containing protein n=1 Tax=Triparma strigata TaxID=1606541 RepID=A0A9W7AUF7_9STRA|nr:hypothetical protein TrST_g7816 [Triparma strigata]